MAARYKTSLFSGTRTASTSAARKPSAYCLFLRYSLIAWTSCSTGEETASESIYQASKKAGTVARLSFYPVREALELIADLNTDHSRTDGHFRLDELGRRSEYAGVRVRQVRAEQRGIPAVPVDAD